MISLSCGIQNIWQGNSRYQRWANSWLLIIENKKIEKKKNGRGSKKKPGNTRARVRVLGHISNRGEYKPQSQKL